MSMRGRLCPELCVRRLLALRCALCVVYARFGLSMYGPMLYSFTAQRLTISTLCHAQPLTVRAVLGIQVFSCIAQLGHLVL